MSSFTSEASESKSEGSNTPNILTYRYPTNTAGSDATTGTYYHNLNPEIQHEMEVVKKWIHDNHIDMKALGHYSLHDDLTILRYLRANGIRADKAIQHMEKNIEYRKEMNVDEIMNKLPEQNLGAPIQDLCKYIQHWQYGFDKAGRPVLYKQYESFDASAIKKMTSFEQFMKYHMWEQEVVMKMMVDQSHRTGTIVDTMSVVVDIKGMRLGQVNRDFLHLLKLIGQMDAAQFPEILGRLYIINVPSAFPIVWKLIKLWLDPITAQKIHIYAGPNEWRPKVFDFIGEENMPSTYGGKLPALSIDSHPYATYMTSFVPGTTMEYWTTKSWQTSSAATVLSSSK